MSDRPRVLVTRVIPDAGLDPVRAACDCIHATFFSRRAASPTSGQLVHSSPAGSR